MRERSSRARGGVALLTISLSTVGWTVVLAAPPARADCPITDPICAIEETVDPAIDVVDPIVDEVTEEVIDPTIGAVVEVSEDVEDTIAPGEGLPVQIGEPAAPVEGPDAGGGADPPPTAPSDPTDPVGPANPGSDPDGSPIGDAELFGASGRDGNSSGLPQAPPPTPGASELTSGAGIRRSFMDRLGQVIVGAAKALAFPVLLAILVGAFLLVQNRMDRRDPRLALAPVRPGDLTFD